MTCIVGIAHKGSVFIGGDSAGVSGLDVDRRKDRKVFRNGDFIFGFTSSFRMGQLLNYALEPPEYDETNEMKFMTTTFINAIRECLKEGGFAKREKEVEEGGTFLVGFRGKLYTVYDDYQVAENLNGIASVGCGESYAKGSLFTTANMKKPPKERILLALKAAEEFSGGVSSPFFIETLKK